MKSYSFYYFGRAPGSIPYFEVLDCADDFDAEARCRGVLAGRGDGAAEVWMDDRMICRMAPKAPTDQMAV